MLTMKKNNGKSRKSIFDNRKVVLVISVILAVFSWIVVAGFIKPGETATLTDVTINYRQKESNYKNLGLSMIGDLRQTVSVEVEGDSNVIYKLKSTDVVVSPDYSNITGPGTYVVPLRATREAEGNFEVVKISPETVTLQFETMETMTITVQGKADGIEAATGYFKDTPIVTPSTIDVTGPSSIIETIASAVAEVPDKEVRSESKYYGTSVKLLDEKDEPVDTKLLTLSSSEVEITVPILEVREIPIVPMYTGLPEGFDTDWFNSLVTLSEDTIQIAADKEEINNYTESQIGPIDITQFDINQNTYTFPIIFPEKAKNKIKNIEQLNQVTATIDTSTLAQKTFKVDAENVEIVNIGAGLEITPYLRNGLNVTLIGPKEVIEGLLPENITIQVDAYGIAGEQGGQQNIPARIVVASSNKVFAIGQYQIVCEVQTETT